MRIKRFEVGARRAPTHAQAGGDQPLGQRIQGDAFSEARIAPATITASPRNVSGSIIVNSSPPMRPMLAMSGVLRWIRCTSSQITLSPVGWPYSSLIRLKKSISRMIRAAGVRVSVSLMR